MASTGGKLTAVAVRAAVAPGYLNDGNGLYLQIAKGGSKSWVLRYRIDGRLREMGLGSAKIVTLAVARAKAMDAQRQRDGGIDPIAAKRQVAAPVAGRSFKEVAALYIGAHRSGWKNAKHALQWGATLETYAYPHIGELPIQAVGTSEVLATLTPIWASKGETAKRVRGRIEAVLSYAGARGWRDGPNPAALKGHLDKLLPARSKVAPLVHHPAMAYSELPAFMRDLRARSSVSAWALEFCILTAARTGEILGATWAETDTVAGVWTVPGARMKSGREHRVPLSKPALELLAKVAALRPVGASHAAIFPGQSKPGTEQHGLDDAATWPAARPDGAWFPKLVSRLGGQRNQLSPRTVRGGAGACCGE